MHTISFFLTLSFSRFISMRFSHIHSRKYFESMENSFANAKIHTHENVQCYWTAFFLHRIEIFKTHNGWWARDVEKKTTTAFRFSYALVSVSTISFPYYKLFVLIFFATDLEAFRVSVSFSIYRVFGRRAVWPISKWLRGVNGLVLICEEFAFISCNNWIRLVSNSFGVPVRLNRRNNKKKQHNPTATLFGNYLNWPLLMGKT